MYVNEFVQGDISLVLGICTKELSVGCLAAQLEADEFAKSLNINHSAFKVRKGE